MRPQGEHGPAVAAGSGGLSLCDDSCEAVSGGTSVKDVLGHGDVFLGGRTVERSPPTSLRAAGCRPSMRGGGFTEWRLCACNQHSVTPFFMPHQAPMEAGRGFSELPGKQQHVQLRQQRRCGSGVVRATRAGRELFGPRDHSRRRHVHVTLRADGAELRCVATILR